MVELPRWANLARGDFIEQLGNPRVTVRTTARQQLVENDTKAINVATRIDAVPFASGLFRAHIRRSAAVRRAAAERLVAQRQTKIGHQWMPRFVEQNVPRLDVAMYQPALVRMMQRVGDAQYDFGPLVVRRTAPLDQARQVAAGHKFRDNIAQAVVGTAQIIHWHDPGVVEAGQ